MVEDNEYGPGLLEQRYFGAGIKRKRAVVFVPSTAESAPSPNLPSKSSSSVADRYLAVVLAKPDGNRQPSPGAPREEKLEAIPTDEKSSDDGIVDLNSMTTLSSEQSRSVVCDICKRAIHAADVTSLHESSITHQICLQHSHPPSRIDRSRKGLAVLESHGWDPDSRLGLGVQGEGRLHPVKAKENPRRAGLGVNFDIKAKSVEKPVKLDAGKVRNMERQNKKKAERLRDAFYRNEDVERYLSQ